MQNSVFLLGFTQRNPSIFFDSFLIIICISLWCIPITIARVFVSFRALASSIIIFSLNLCPVLAFFLTPLFLLHIIHSRFPFYLETWLTLINRLKKKVLQWSLLTKIDTINFLWSLHYSMLEVAFSFFYSLSFFLTFCLMPIYFYQLFGSNDLFSCFKKNFCKGNLSVNFYFLIKCFLYSRPKL